MYLYVSKWPSTYTSTGRRVERFDRQKPMGSVLFIATILGTGGARRWTEASVVPPSTLERYLIWGAQCAPRNAPRILTYILLAVGLIPLFDNAPGLVSDVRGKNKRRRSSPAPRHPSWPVAASSPSTVCELDAVTRIDLVARPIYIGPSNVLCRAAGRVQRGKTACRASQGRAGQGSVALSDSLRAARNSRVCEGTTSRYRGSIAGARGLHARTRYEVVLGATHGPLRGIM